MVYQSKFVAAIKVNGQILREHNSTVTIPFGCEYSILLKNLNTVRCQVKITIDGTEATDGWLILNPNSSLDFERFIKNGNLDRGNKFKFIERTEAVEKHRGIKEDDGLVRVEYKMERAVVNYPIIRYDPIYVPDCVPDRRRRRTDPWRNPWNSLTRSSGSRSMRSANIGGPIGASQVTPTSSSFSNCSTSDYAAVEASLNDAGITVAGSESNQQFVYTSGFETDASEVIVLKLRGQVGGKVVKQAITVKTKPKCSSCGLNNKGTNQFCSRCGTSLKLL